VLDNWLPAAVEASRRLTREDAVKRLLGTYLRSAAISQPRFMTNLFSLEVGEVEGGLSRMEADGRIRRDQRVKGLPGSWVVWDGES
jgi:hypothetical protein